MNLRRKVFLTIAVVFALSMGTEVLAQPVFENQTPTAFSASDSTGADSVVTANELTVRVDLNGAATAEFPVIGNFSKVEKSVPFFSSPNTAAYMSQAIAVDNNGVIHRAWIQRRGFSTAGTGTSTPVYGVVYAKSLDGGSTFSDTVSVSGSLRFDLITTNIAMSSAFSTVDIVVNSKGNPRVVYAMDNSADGFHGGGLAGLQTQQGTAAPNHSFSSFDNIYFNYSNDGGSTWLPSNNAVIINNVVDSTAATFTNQGRKNGFPRMALTTTDDVFITYTRNYNAVAGARDIMLAKVPEDSLKLGSAQASRIGAEGTIGSFGGVRIDPDADGGLGSDIAIGDDDVIHLVWFDPFATGAAASAVAPIRHKAIRAADWTRLDAFGWNQNVNGQSVATFNTSVSNQGVLTSVAVGALQGDYNSLALIGGMHLFPTVVIDRERTPDRIYVLWKHTDALGGVAAIGADENIAYAIANYDGSVGANLSFGTTQFAFPTGAASTLYQVNGGGLFQNGTRYQVEGFWGFVDRITAVVDKRIPGTRGDLHVVFSGGGSTILGLAGVQDIYTSSLSDRGIANNLYYSRFNGNEWELPKVVATAKDGAIDGILARHKHVFEPDIAIRSGDDNIYMTFMGGSPTDVGARVAARTGIENLADDVPGRGTAALSQGNIDPLPYFKILGRVVSFDDVSQPSGAFVYDLKYTPKNPQTSEVLNNLVEVSAASTADGSGIGGATPGASAAPGGFLTGQWRQASLHTLGVASLNIGEVGATFKGAISASHATNDNGVWEGLADDDGTSGFPEWGDNADKNTMLVKLNVLGSNSSTNVFSIVASSASKVTAGTGQTGVPDSSTQSISITTTAGVAGLVTGPQVTTFVRGITGEGDATGATAALGSYFWIGANVDILAANESPSVSIVSPNASTTGFSNETASIQYTLFDIDNNVATASTGLQMELYAYPDNGLSTVQDIRTFALLIADEQDENVTVNTATGTNDFVEGSSASNTQTYTWDDPGAALQALGFAPITKALESNYFIYIVADDFINPPIFSVSAGALTVRHIPIVRSISPVSADTADTGEFNQLDKTNPYTIKFTIDDFDNNAQMRLFVSINSALSTASISTTGIFPNLTIELAGATAIQLSDTLTTDQDIQFDFDITAQGSARDSVIVQGNYFIYAVVADEDTTVLGISTQALAIRHSPAYEFTNPILGEIDKLNTARQFSYSIEWQRGRSDQDLDGNALISLYYVGVDPQVKDFSGRDSSTLIDSGAVLIVGGLREDDEGAADQYIWDFRNPPSELPNTMRSLASTADDPNNPHVYQVGEVDDTVWLYAVLHDSLSNTRVQGGGAVLLLGSQEDPASQVPRVTMQTPPSGGQDLTNGDVVRVEWDAFLIDDGTGTDDAYLRLYAAPTGKYTTLTELEGHNLADTPAVGEQNDVIILNSLTGRDDVTTNISTLRESGPSFFLWDTKTSSFGITGTPTEYDIFVAASMDPQFGDNVHVNNVVDSVATGVGSNAQLAVLSKSPGTLRVTGVDPNFSMEMSPGGLAVSSGDTLDFLLLMNSQGSSVNIISAHLDVPRTYFEVIDQDAGTAGMQPFADSTGAFQSSSTIAQNDTTTGTAQFIKLNFVESVTLGEAIGKLSSPFDSSQVAAKLQFRVKRFQGGAPLDTLIGWSTESGRESGLYDGVNLAAVSYRPAKVTMMPRSRIIATVPLQGRTNYTDTMDVHIRDIGNVHDITDQDYIGANDITPVITGGGSSTTLEDSVQVLSDAFGTFTITEIPPGIYEMTVKAKGYVSGRTDTLNLFNGLTSTPDPTFGSDALGNLSPATPLGELRGGDATGDNQIDVSDANRIFALWNLTPSDAGFVRDADVNGDGVVNTLDLGFVSTNFGNDGFGAPPVFKRIRDGGDNSGAIVKLEGIEDVEAWWPGKVFEVKATIAGMSDVAAYGFSLSYDPERVKPLPGTQVVSQGNIFAANPRGALFFHRAEDGVVDVTSGRVGHEWSAQGEAELATIRFQTLTDDPGEIRILSGELGNSDFRGTTMKVQQPKALPKVAALNQNYPNPFNPSTEISFAIPTARDVHLRIYNQLGQEIRTLVDNRVKAGHHSYKWNGKTDHGLKVATGVYFYSLEAGDFSQIRKMTLVK